MTDEFTLTHVLIDRKIDFVFLLLLSKSQNIESHILLFQLNLNETSIRTVDTSKFDSFRRIRIAVYVYLVCVREREIVCVGVCACAFTTCSICMAINEYFRKK